MVPFLFMAYLCFRIWIGNLLAVSARTRLIALYFLRIIVVFFVFWLPNIILANMERRNIDWEGLPLHYIHW